MIGIATHYQHKGRVACGTAGARYTTTERKRVDCARCRHTKRYRQGRAK